MSRTLVIAEPGCTHEGDYAAIVTLIHVAAESGADVFKNQWTSDPDQMIARRRVPADPYRRYYGWLNYPLAWHEHFRRISHELGMQYACSVYLPQDVATIDPLVDLHKVASFEAADPEMLEAHRNSKVLVSFGMMSEAEFDTAKMAWRHHNAQYLYCVSAYPTPLDAIDLAVFWPQEDIYDFAASPFDGLSDHSRNLITGAVAVGAGAKIIETHFRLETCSPANPDYAVAFTPAEFTQYIRNIRDAEQMLGDGVKRQQPCEVEMAKFRVGAP